MKKTYRTLVILSIGLFVGGLWASEATAPDNSLPVTTTQKILPNMIPTAEIPNAPSLAKTKGNKQVHIDDWEDPEVCGGCHTVQYDGWKGSMHSNSFKDPIFQAEWALAEKAVGGNISKLCGGCHSPSGMLSDTIKFDPKLGKHGGFTAPKVAEAGVSCDVCHTISGSSFSNSSVVEHGNGSYVSDPGKVKYGEMEKWEISVATASESLSYHTRVSSDKLRRVWIVKGVSGTRGDLFINVSCGVGRLLLVPYSLRFSQLHFFIQTVFYWSD